MKCKECKYHDEEDVCYDQCGFASSKSALAGIVCSNNNVRKGMTQETCVWNCDFCTLNRGTVLKEQPDEQTT